MARRKRKDETPVWSPPEFDEVAFMRREMEGAKAAVVTVGWAGLGSLVTFGLFSLGGAIFGVVAFFGGLLFAAGLYFVLPYVRVDTSGFKRRDWAGHGSVYFFSWLAFWILLLNAPVGDYTNPQVYGFQTAGFVASSGPQADTLFCVSGESVDLTVGANDSIYVLFRASDNVGVAGVQVRVNGNPASASPVGGQESPCRGAGFLTGDAYAVSFPDAASTYEVVVTATDASGRSAEGRMSIRT